MKVRAKGTKDITAPEMSTSAEDTNADNDNEMTTDADIPLLDRDTYRRIKKMDRASLEELIQNVHESGRQKGRTEASEALKEATLTTPAADDSDDSLDDEIALPPDDHNSLDLRELEKSIKAVKGVGEKRAEEIMGIIEHWLGV